MSAIPRVAPRMPPNSESCSENGLFTPRAFFSKLGWFPGFDISGQRKSLLVIRRCQDSQREMSTSEGVRRSGELLGKSGECLGNLGNALKILNVVALYRAMRLQVGYGFESRCELPKLFLRASYFFMKQKREDSFREQLRKLFTQTLFIGVGDFGGGLPSLEKIHSVLLQVPQTNSSVACLCLKDQHGKRRPNSIWTPYRLILLSGTFSAPPLETAPNPPKFAPACTRRPKRPKQTCTNLHLQALFCELRIVTNLPKFAPPHGRHPAGGANCEFG